MNQLKLNSKVFSIHHAEGGSHPKHYMLQELGTVSELTDSYIKFGPIYVYPGKNADTFFKPSSDGFCYYMAELPNMKQYKFVDLYKVPTALLKDHMKSYKSPWEVQS